MSLDKIPKPRPWESEPDSLDFMCGDLPCAIRRSPHTGTLCGYVGVQRGHPCYSLHYDKVQEIFDISAYGGLTYSGDRLGLSDHPLQAWDDYWWLGFDCAHYGDLMPKLNCFTREIDPLPGTYKTLGMVKTYVQALALRLSALTRRPTLWGSVYGFLRRLVTAPRRLILYLIRRQIP